MHRRPAEPAPRPRFTPATLVPAAILPAAYLRAAFLLAATVVAALIIAPSVARADELGDLAAQLARLPATDEVQGTLEVQVTRQSAEEQWADQSRVSVEVDENAQGMHVGLPRTTARQTLAELRAQIQDPSKHTPTYNALQVLTLNEAAGDLDSAAALAQDIALAKLVEIKSVTYTGKPARLFVLTLPPRLSEEARKHIKTADSQLSVWVGADGLPMGAEKLEHTKGRFLVLFFESLRKQTWVFGHKGNRLFAAHHEVSDSASGMGQDYRSTVIANLSLR